MSRKRLASAFCHRFSSTETTRGDRQRSRAPEGSFRREMSEVEALYGELERADAWKIGTFNKSIRDLA